MHILILIDTLKIAFPKKKKQVTFPPATYEVHRPWHPCPHLMLPLSHFHHPDGQNMVFYFYFNSYFPEVEYVLLSLLATSMSLSVNG